MILYRCELASSFGSAAGLRAHPYSRATKALDAAGLSLQAQDGQRRRSQGLDASQAPRDRAEVERQSGQRAAPILVLDVVVVVGSGSIARWANEDGSADDDQMVVGSGSVVRRENEHG